MNNCMGICPKCGDKDFGGHTVLNSVDKILQVSSLLKRLKKENHGHIIECNKCKTVYEDDTKIILTDDEITECNKIWETEGEY